MDSLLGSLFGNDGDETQQRAKAEDFVNRVETGDPTQGFSDEEAVRNYSSVASKLSPNELEEAATDALQRFSPEQRREFAGLLEKHGVAAGNVDPNDPRQLAHLTSQLQSQSPDGLVGLLGGGSLDSILGGLMGGGGSSSSGGGGGIADMIGGLLGGGDDQRDTSRRSSGSGSSQAGGLDDLLGSPIAKAILAAIAAMAMKKFMGGGGLPSFGGGGDSDSGRGGGRDIGGDDNNPFGGGQAPRRTLGDLEGGSTKKA